MDLKAMWNNRYRESQGVSEVARVLQENRHLLPTQGRALDVACGLGANARLLAGHGLETLGWDFSQVAIERFAALAANTGLPVRGEVRDVVEFPPTEESFDVIVVSHFLERSLAPNLQGALRPGGILFFQTFTRTKVDDTGPSNPEFRLDDNELLRLFAGLRILVYREEGRAGNVRLGFRNEAMLVGQKV